MKIQQLLRDNAQRQKPAALVVRNAADEATVYIYDVIDAWWGISAKSVIEQLNQVADVGTLHLRINSPGGGVAGRSSFAPPESGAT